MKFKILLTLCSFLSLSTFADQQKDPRMDPDLLPIMKQLLELKYPERIRVESIDFTGTQYPGDAYSNLDSNYLQPDYKICSSEGHNGDITLTFRAIYRKIADPTKQWTLDFSMRTDNWHVCAQDQIVLPYRYNQTGLPYGDDYIRESFLYNVNTKKAELLDRSKPKLFCRDIKDPYFAELNIYESSVQDEYWVALDKVESSALVLRKCKFASEEAGLLKCDDEEMFGGDIAVPADFKTDKATLRLKARTFKGLEDLDASRHRYPAEWICESK